MRHVPTWLLLFLAAVVSVAMVACSSESSTKVSEPTTNEYSLIDENAPELSDEAKDELRRLKGGEEIQADITYDAHLCPDAAFACEVRNTSRSDVANWNYISFDGTAGNEVTISVTPDDELDVQIWFARGTTTSTTGISYNFGLGSSSGMTRLAVSDAGGSCGATESITYTLPTTGAYTVLIFRNSAAVCSTGVAFEITVSGCDEGDDCVVDSDGDGIPDDEDSYPESNTDPEISIDGCDSGVDNEDLGSGAYMMDLIAACAASAANHGQFVSCINSLANEWKQDGLITNQQKSAITNCASNSSLP